MLELDGSHGEGGGQLVRTACALSALTGTAVRLHDVRARRSPPGLAPQHLAAVRAVGALCGAELEGAGLRAREFTFRPGPIRAGAFRFDVGTAGAVTLVLQACLPVACAAPAPVSLTITGGTDVRAAPPLDYLRLVFLPLLVRLGLEVTLEIGRRGYYPRGGGEVTLHVEPRRPRPLAIETPGKLMALGGSAHCANLPAHIVERMRAAALAILGREAEAQIAARVLGADEATGPGGAIVLWARTEQALLGAAAVAERGVPAERLGEQAARELRAALDAGATLDLHAADQLLVYLAQSTGPSLFTVERATSHLQTVMWVIEQFLPARFRLRPVGPHTRLEVRPHRDP